MQTQNKLKIGAIGGMGPLSSVRFYADIIDYSQRSCGVFLNKDFPHVVISNLPVPDLINSVTDSDTSIQMVIDEIKRLENYGVDVVTIVCNTMHLYIDQFQKATHLPFLNILEETAEYLSKNNRHKVGILATPMTLKYNLYQSALEKKNIQTIIPSPEEISQLGKVIPLILGGKSTETDKQRVMSIIQRLKEQDVDTMLFGCTELGLLVNQDDIDIPLISSMTILSQAVTDLALGRRVL